MTYNTEIIDMKDEQIRIAVNALHVIAVTDSIDADLIIEIALDALREIETCGYFYENSIEEDL